MSPLAAIETHVGTVKVELAGGGVGGRASRKWRLKGREASSGAVTEEDGDGGGTMIG